MNLTPRKALALFIALVIFLFAQAIWWVVFMEIMADEKVELAEKLGASAEYLDILHQEEISRQMMIGMEGFVFLLLILLGVWLIYRSLRKLEELKFHQENFLMAVTHELKTPLSSIMMYLDTLESEKVPSEKKIPIIPRMKEDVNHLSKLVDNVLDAGRFERSGYRLRSEWFDLSKLINNRLDILAGTPFVSLERIERKIKTEVEIFGDPKAFTRAIDSIIENSVKYGIGDRTVLIVELATVRDKIEFCVSDNGIGLERRELKSVFERFYRVGSELTGGRDGSGLGLYLCREIIRAHGGEIKAHSAGLGKGATFSISLKRSERPENDFVG